MVTPDKQVGLNGIVPTIFATACLGIFGKRGGLP